MNCVFPIKDVSQSLHSCSVCQRKIFGVCMADKFENNEAVLCRHCITMIAGLNLLTYFAKLMLTIFSLIVDNDTDNKKAFAPVDDSKNADSLENETSNALTKRVNGDSKHVEYSPFDLHIFFKDMKDNHIDLTIDVGGKKKSYSITFDPDDNLSNQKQVLKGNLIKRIYSKEETETKWREKLFGYDVYWGYNSSIKKIGYICPSMICTAEGASTGLVLKRILRTRCANPKLWMVIYCIADDQCYIVREHIGNWMKREPHSNTDRDWWTNPCIAFDHEKCSK